MITSITEEGGKDLVILNKLLTNQEYECFTLINYVNEPQGVHRLNSMSIELKKHNTRTDDVYQLVIKAMSAQ